jgi:integrase/recombinase XerC
MDNNIASFLSYLAHQKQYSEHTLKAYSNDLLSFKDYVELFYEVKLPEDVSRRMVSSFIAELAEQGLAPRTINRKLSAIQSFFNHLHKRDILQQNPVRNIQRPKTPKRLPSIIRSEQVRSLLAEETFTNDFEGLRDRALLSTFYACGLRRDELIGLKGNNIDWVTGQIKVLGKRNKERIIPIGNDLLQVLDAYKRIKVAEFDEREVFFLTSKGEKMYPSLVYQIVKNYLSKVTTIEKKSPHVLRHTFATHLLNEGANLQSIKELLGHESLATTQVYTHTSLAQLKEIYNKAHPRGKK